MQEKEIWKDIKGFEGCYQVSNLGQVKSIPKYLKTELGFIPEREEKILKPVFLIDGHLQVHLYRTIKKGTLKRRPLIHQLVAEAFNLEKLNKNDCNIFHIDGNKENNNINNLMYATGTNIRNIRGKAVLKLNENGEIIKEYYSIKHAADDNNIHRERVKNLCTGFTKKNKKGFIFKYKEK